MAKLSYKISYYALYVMFAAIVVVLALFYFGGQMSTPLVTDITNNPANTDALIGLMYVFLGLAILISIVAVAIQFGLAFKDNPKVAIRSLLGLVVFVLLLVITWALGSDEILNIKGYEGTDNTPFWLKLTDMFLYSLYFLIGACIIAIIGSSIKKRFLS